MSQWSAESYCTALNDPEVILTLCALAQCTSVRPVFLDIHSLVSLVTSLTGSLGGGCPMSPLFGAAAISNSAVAADQV